ncbi:acyltransferase family protein [Streptomyces lavendofoliae]|uniref:acyltransferase family protein n=1 Tax=Streptomyces lavendofoliae TaxID=67314 RepID=UPI003D8A035D
MAQAPGAPSRGGAGRRGVPHRAPSPGGRPRVGALDGMRGVAVAAVLAYHGGIRPLSGGFLGVDAFFVLSGYLITTLLLAEWDREGRIRLAAFWSRRAKRLLPALVVVVVVVCAVAPLVVAPEELSGLRADALATLAYVANWRMVVRGTDYFAQMAAPSLLQHMWSLGVEEQFYLLWPLLLVVVARAAGARARVPALVLVAAVAGVAASVGACLVLSASAADPGRLYFGSDTRAMSVLVGCALAAALARWPGGPGRGRPVLGRVPAGSALIGAVAVAWLWSHASGSDPWLYPGGLLAGSLGTAAVLAHAVLAPRSVTARLLSLPGLPALGRISYGVYLWHWPLFAWLNGARTGLSGGWLFAVRCAVTVLVAAASFVLLERPVQRGGAWWLRRSAPVLGGAFGLLVLVGGSVVALVPTAARTPVVAPPVSPADPPAPPEAGRSPDGTAPATPSRRGPVSVVVMGDSVAWSLVRYLPRTPGVAVLDRTTLGCGLVVGSPYRYFGTERRVSRACTRWPVRLRDAVEQERPDVVMILAGRWETMDRVHQGRWTQVGDPVFDRHMLAQLDRAVKLAAGRGARVVLATEPYNRRGERPDGGLWPEDRPERVDRWNALLRKTAARHPGTVRILDLGRRLCPDGTFTWRVNGVQVRSDGVHLTPEGVRLITPWLMTQLTAAAR